MGCWAFNVSEKKKKWSYHGIQEWEGKSNRQWLILLTIDWYMLVELSVLCWALLSYMYTVNIHLALFGWVKVQRDQTRKAEASVMVISLKSHEPRSLCSQQPSFSGPFTITLRTLHQLQWPIPPWLKTCSSYEHPTLHQPQKATLSKTSLDWLKLTPKPFSFKPERDHKQTAWSTQMSTFTCKKHGILSEANTLIQGAGG